MKNEKNKNEFMKANLILLFLLYKNEKRNKNAIGMIKINLIISLNFKYTKTFLLECIFN